MKYKLQIRSYKRSFKKPLFTSQCTLNSRMGLIIRLESNSGIGFGEIAPMPFLGSESFEDAKIFCAQMPCEVNDDFIKSIDARFPCCKLGIQRAQKWFGLSPIIQRKFEVAALLSLADTQNLLNYKDYKACKCKIGIDDFEEEMKAFIKLHSSLPSSMQFRLDANGSLSYNQAKQWFSFLSEFNNIQFLEQPLPKGQESLMIKLACDYRTPIALDESVINIIDFEKNLQKGWKGWMVIKPSLIGDLDQFTKLRTQCEAPIVYSSVFETAIGIETCLALAATDYKNEYALGLGTIDYFYKDKFGFHPKGPHINSGEMTINDFERIWNLCDSIS